MRPEKAIRVTIFNYLPRDNREKTWTWAAPRSGTAAARAARARCWSLKALSCGERFRAPRRLETSRHPALGRIEGNDPDGIAVLAVHQLDDDRLAVGQFVIGFRPGAAEWPPK
jgi:hypothetical protein